jgi:hypothetical protein
MFYPRRLGQARDAGVRRSLFAGERLKGDSARAGIQTAFDVQAALFRFRRNRATELEPGYVRQWNRIKMADTQPGVASEGLPVP